MKYFVAVLNHGICSEAFDTYEDAEIEREMCIEEGIDLERNTDTDLNIFEIREKAEKSFRIVEKED